MSSEKRSKQEIGRRRGMLSAGRTMGVAPHVGAPVGARKKAMSPEGPAWEGSVLTKPGAMEGAAAFVEPTRWIQRAYYLEARRGFPTDSSLAEAVGVSRSQITRWSRGEPAQRENVWLLRDLAAAVSRLADHFEDATIHRWLFGSNPDLEGEQPIELLRQGRLPEVLMAVEAQTSGAFG